TDVARADVASLLAYEARAHSPEKVSVVVAGPEPTETSLALARRWFADVPVRTPPSPVAGRPFAGEAVLETPGRGLYSWRDAVRADAIYLAWPTVPRGHPDEPALDILARSLGEGSEPSLSAGRRMRRAGVQTVECWTLNGRYGGLFVVELRTTGRDPAAALAALQHAWKQARPDPARLRAVQVGWHADAIRSSQGVEALAGRVIECMGRGAPADCARSDLRRYAQVRTDALARVRERWLRPERQTILMVVDPARAVPPGAEPVVLP
ncbi:MAG: insulinase family protein, partial [Myxococcota bacterium]|nr:insulinase family protein [Myxococcota bacterium]